MRLHRIALENFRGVECSEVAFARDGVTVVEGPNEIGKSSLAEALDVLLDHPHDSKKRQVLAVKPVHRDVGTRVEAELTTGPYHFVYAKQWFRRPETVLTVLAPSKANLTGREAHDRVVAMLDETLDRALFAALRVVQGERVDQPVPSSSTALVAALDRAAAGTADPETESSLREAILAERAAYFTDTGRPVRAREERAKTLAAAEQRVAGAKAFLEGLESDSDILQRIERDLAAVEEQRARNRPELEKLTESRREIERLRESLAPREVELAAARSGLEAALRELAHRNESVESLARAGENLSTLVAALKDAEPSVARAVEAEQVARRTYEEAQRGYDAHAEDLAVAEADFVFRRAELDSAQLSERLDRVIRSKEAEAEARRFLEGCTVTEAVRAEVEAALLEVTQARSALEVASPPLGVEAHAEVDVALNGQWRRLGPGDRIDSSVGDRMELHIGDQVTVTVGGGGAVMRYEAALAEAQRVLDRLVRARGLDAADPRGSINAVLERRAVAEHALAGAQDVRQAALRDLTEEELSAKLAGARDKVEGYPTSRGGRPTPATIEEAENIRDGLAGEAARAREELEAHRRAWEASRETCESLAGDAKTRSAVAEQAAVEVNGMRERLEVARAQRSDEDLGADEVGARRDLQVAEEQWAAAQREIESRDPVEVQLRHENALAVENRCREESAALHEQKVRVEERLAVKAEQDVQAAHDAAVQEAETLRSEHEGVERRAAAAKLLFEVFERHRQAQLRAYVAPYRAEIERLARLVFSPDAEVEVDPEDFSLVSRTVKGVTVPFDSLSTGAREQLGILARLACAVLVSPDGGGPDPRSDSGSDGGGPDPTPVPAPDGGGVPVILDDALGYSDPDRLRDLGVALGTASKRAQVIVMTSTPDRYSWVGGATVVRLGRDRGARERPGQDGSVQERLVPGERAADGGSPADRDGG